MNYLGILKEAGKRVYNFIVGPSLLGGVYPIDAVQGSPRPGRQPHKDRWVLNVGGDAWIDSAPGFHFDSIGMELRVLWFGIFVAWVDNG